MLTVTGDLNHRLPVAPILAQLRLRGGLYVALTAAGFASGTRDRDRVEKAVERAAEEGSLTVAAADILCCTVLGVHPSLVYGDHWWVGQLSPHWHEGVAS